MFATFIAALAFVGIAMAGLGLGVILRGKSIKGHCGARGCSGNTCSTPELAMSPCKRTIHLPGA